MGMLDGSCKNCGKSLSDYSKIRYSRPNPTRGMSQYPWNYCCEECYKQGAAAYNAEAKKPGNSYNSDTNIFAGIFQWLLTWLLTKVLPFVLPYIGWFGVILLPFFFGNDRSFSDIPLGGYIFSAILGIGIGIAIKLIRLPEKYKKFEKFRKPLLWLPIIVTGIFMAIVIIMFFVG